MATTNIVASTSKFHIYSSFTLSQDDVHALTLLYAPLIGNDAFTLYMGLNALLERNNLKSEEIIHQDLFDIYSLKPVDFMRSKNKLEKTLTSGDEGGKGSALEQIGKIDERIRKVRIDLGKEKAILKRMGEMEQKEQKAEMAMAGKSLRNNAGQKKNLQKEGERLSVMQI